MLGGVADRLTAAGCVAAQEEAEPLVAAPDGETLEGWVRRRERGEPLAWITGTVRFCGRTVHVDPRVYVPRLQTEELARRAARLLAAAVDSGRAVDLCTGSGAVAAQLLAEVPTATVVGVDVDVRAAACARRNGVPVLVGDLDQPPRPGSIDVSRPSRRTSRARTCACFRPTSSATKPRRALDGGRDGLVIVRRVVPAAARLLRPGGWLLTEIGGDEDELHRPALAAAGFDDVTAWSDEDGDLRGLAAQLGS